MSCKTQNKTYPNGRRCGAPERWWEREQQVAMRLVVRELEQRFLELEDEHRGSPHILIRKLRTLRTLQYREEKDWW